MGHSLGGLLVMHTFVHHKDLFNAYVAIDAALWWDSHKLLTESKPALETNTYENKTLFLDIANRMEKGVDTTAVQADTDEQTELIRYNLELIHHLQRQGQNKLRFKPVYYKHDTHGTVSFRADNANRDFVMFLNEMTPPKEVIDLYHVILKDTFGVDAAKKEDEMAKLKGQMGLAEKRLSALTDKFLDELIDKDTYVQKRAAYKAELMVLSDSLRVLEM